VNLVSAIIALSALVLAFWLRAAGTALARIPRADALRDASDDRRGARRVSDLLDSRETIGPAVGVVASGLLVVAAVVGVAGFAASLDSGATLGIALAVGVVVFLLGDLIPRGLGRRTPRSFAYRSARVIGVAVSVGGWANDLLPDTDPEDESLEVAFVDDEMNGQERELIDSVLDFAETTVREVMTPRPDMVTVEVTSTLDELVERATEEGYSRVPVVSDGDVVGLVIVKDLLPLLSGGHRPSIAEVMRPVEFVPESKLASALLSEMQESRVHQMIVADEYGDVAGLVTIEDLLEELVGEIADETDDEEVFIRRSGNGSWVVDARLAVDDLAREANIELPDEDWDTVGGLVLGLAERIPEVGETFTHGGLTLAVLGMQGRRISQVQVTVDEAVEA